MPVVLAIDVGLSPSSTMNTRAEILKPSFSITRTALPYRSSSAEAATTRWSSSAGCAAIACSAVLIRL
jgi:hypothetical protein